MFGQVLFLILSCVFCFVHSVWPRNLPVIFSLPYALSVIPNTLAARQNIWLGNYRTNGCTIRFFSVFCLWAQFFFFFAFPFSPRVISLSFSILQRLCFQKCLGWWRHWFPCALFSARGLALFCRLIFIFFYPFHFFSRGFLASLVVLRTLWVEICLE